METDTSPDPGARLDPTVTNAADLSRYLVSRAQRGSESVWTVIRDRYHARLLAYAELRIGPRLRSTCEASDVVQEAWHRIVRGFEDFVYHQNGSLYSWLCLQIDRITADWGRRKQLPREPGELAPGSPDEERVGGPAARGPATEVGFRDEVRRAVEALEDPSLPSIYRLPLVLVYLECRDVAEVAAALDRKPGTVRKQVQRGLEIWRGILGRDPLSSL